MFGEAGAIRTAEIHRGGDLAVAHGVSSAASGGANAPIAPGRYGAVSGAVMLIATFGDDVACATGTFNATVGIALDDTASLDVSTTTATLGAAGPAGPAGDDAVDRARLGVARCFTYKRRANSTATARTEGYSAYGHLAAAAANKRATQMGPFANSTVLVVSDKVAEAWISVARLCFSLGGTCSATIAGRSNNCTVHQLLAETTLLAANPPGCPFTDLAVDGAGVGVAVHLLESGATCHATV